MPQKNLNPKAGKKQPRESGAYASAHSEVHMKEWGLSYAPSTGFGGVAYIGVSGRSSADLDSLVRRGLETRFLQHLIDDGSITEHEVYAHVIPRRTLSHRKAKGQRLSQAESEKALRIAMITAMAFDVFGNREKAGAWLRRETKPLGKRKPLDLLDTEVGGREVENLLNRIAHGFAA